MKNRFHEQGRSDFRKAVDHRRRIREARQALRLAYRDALAGAGLLTKCRIHLQIRREARESVGPSDHALFSSARR